MSRRKAMSVGCGGKGCKPRKDWSEVVGRCGPGERNRIEAGHARYLNAHPHPRGSKRKRMDVDDWLRFLPFWAP